MARKKKVKYNVGPWGVMDLAVLKKYFRNESTRKLAEELNRPYTAVRKMASRLGLRKSRRHMKKLGKLV
ncbi:MAG TPA: hypothetical protein VMW24_23260 [Sedimentisphaerales bacterium]|nr:hypothetical protein [Sedimentisphaerales bacterium]